ncbi:MAG: RNA methyltransferase, partial [Firmicutes bacterium]|nr:RNA methyltransferase [Bacillota bacterium]
MTRIESAQNKTFKETKALLMKKHRKEFFIAEGAAFVREIPEDYYIERFMISESFAKKNDFSEFECRAKAYLLKDEIFSSLSDTKTPQGILAVVRKKRIDPENVIKNGSLFVIAENIRDPGNIGTLIRTADAAGADAVFLCKTCADLFSGKTLRSTMGSIFHLPVFEDMDIIPLIKKMQASNIQVCAAHLKGKISPYECELRKKTALLIGSEAHGLSEEASAAADILLRLPMPGCAESLNAGVA